MFNRKLCTPFPYQMEKKKLESSIDWGSVPTTLNHVCQRCVKDSPKVRSPEIGLLNCRLTWQSCLLDKAFCLPIINENGLLVTRKLCSTLSSLSYSTALSGLSLAGWMTTMNKDDDYSQSLVIPLCLIEQTLLLSITAQRPFTLFAHTKQIFKKALTRRGRAGRISGISIYPSVGKERDEHLYCFHCDDWITMRSWCVPIIQVVIWHREQKSIEEGGSRDQFLFILMGHLIYSIRSRASIRGRTSRRVRFRAFGWQIEVSR